MCVPTFRQQQLVSILLTPAGWLHIPRVCIGPEVIAFWVTIKVKPHPVALDLRETHVPVRVSTTLGDKDTCLFVCFFDSHQHTYLCDGEHTEQGGVRRVQSLQLHSHLKAVPALRKRLVLRRQTYVTAKSCVSLGRTN